MIQKNYTEWVEARTTTETCPAAQGAALVARMAELEASIAVLPSVRLADVLTKLELAMAGASGMVESAHADLAPWLAKAEAA